VGSFIGQVPSEGYVNKDKYSKLSIQWLEWIIHDKGLSIQHALNGGEVSVTGTHYRLDGYCVETHTAYEFNGCLWHICPTCYPYDRKTLKHPRTNQSMEELYTLTMKKKQHLQSLGYKYVGIWEHEFADLVKTNANVSDYVRGLDLQERLEPRHAFFGGRTNASRLHYEVKERGRESEIRRFHFALSQREQVRPIPRGTPGHHHRGVHDDGRVLWDRGLHHPVLPYRSQGKLKFPLCRTCADTEQTPCHHSPRERILLGTWCTPELLEAEARAYQTYQDLRGVGLEDQHPVRP
jgi:hypothetical protein